VTLNSGAHVGPYEILDLLGAGGMGEVYRARDTRLGRFVAIKFAAEKFSERFEREARAVAALNHPHICTLYDVGPNYLVMEMVDGQPLVGPLPLERALLFARQILSVLAEAHGKGITHRDLKPGNILITGQGVKLLDFGLAKLATAEVGIHALSSATPESLTVAQPLTAEHTILGTVHYMSPEQAQGRPADARSDIFSFGLVLYEMLTGRRAFDGASPASVIAAIIERDAPSVAAVAPPALDRVLQKCLTKDPGERWQTARDIRHALDLVEDAPGAAVTVRRDWKTLAVASLAAFIAALALAWAIYATQRGPEAESRRLGLHLTPPPGAEFQFSTASGGSAISPDGHTVAFVAVTNGTPRLWIRAFDSLDARELQDTEGAKLPFWSPDGRSLGFFTSVDLRRIDAAGGAATILAPAPDARGGAWNADGVILFSPSSFGPLQRMSADGGTATPLTRLATGETSHRWPQFLPDGRTVLYYSQGSLPAVYVTMLDRPNEAKRMFDSQSQALYFTHPANRQGYVLRVVRDTLVAQRFEPATRELSGSLLSVPGTEGVSSFSGIGRANVTVSDDGTLLYSTGGSRYQLSWFKPDGTASGTVGMIDRYLGLRLSPDGSEALVTIRDPTATDLWLVDLVRGGARTRFTTENRGWYAVWSPDGQEIAFTAPGGLNPMTASAREAGQARSLLASDVPLFPSDWSRDGQYVAYTESRLDTSTDVWLLPMTGERKPIPFSRLPFAELHAQFSPDSRWLAFTSNESGRDDVYVQNVSDAGTRRLVSSSTSGGSYPRWGVGGRELWYRASDGRLMRVPVRMTGSSIELGTPVRLLTLADPPAVHPYPYDVAPDGRILAMIPTVESAQQLTVLMNWQAALEQ
jgi:Tol biopolymer transport system component